MNLEQLIEATRQNCQLGGYADAQPQPDFAAAVNEAYRQISTETEYNCEDDDFPTVVGTKEYTLDNPPDWIRITDVMYGTAVRIAQADDVQVRLTDPNWTQAANSQPVYWWMSSPNVLRFYPAPAAVETIYIRGSREKGPLASGGSPTFPIRYHEAIPLRAAWLILRRNATGTSYERAVAYREEAHSIVGRFKSELQDQRTVVFRRRMVRVPAERFMLGGRSYRRY